MPTTDKTVNKGHNRDRRPGWIALASMFVGQRLDKWAAVGAYVAAAATLAISVALLLVIH
jgi:hypothetical protein